jgi:uncharacterized protein DUF6675
MRTKNCLSRFRDALTFSALLFALPSVCPAQEADRFQLSALQAAQLEPQPPCGQEPIPSYPGLDDSAIVKSWSESDFGRDWRPPACTGWAAVGFTTLSTVVARFRHTSEAEGLLRHIGAISELAGVRYWSTTHKRWQTLIVHAYALTDSQSGQRREDFTPDEMKEGKVLYFEQVDNLSGKAIYRMHIVEAWRTGSSSMSRTSAQCAISSYLSFIRVRCNRSTFWIANRITSGATIASCAQERMPTG